MHSVVKTIPAIEAAFCNPERVTFAGSTIPAEDISTYSPVAALNPSLNGLDFITAVSGAASAISNVGPGLGEVIGPNGNYYTLPDFSKLSLCLGMLLGRLELFAVLVLFFPTFWKD